MAIKPADLWRAFPDTFAERASRGAWTAYPWLQHIAGRITPALVNGGGRFVIEAPPQHGKSEFISNWLPTWYLNHFQDRKVILASYAADYAQKWGSKVLANLTENPTCSIPMRLDMQGKKRFVTQRGGQMITAGIGGPITGEGAHLLIIDDPIKNYEEAVSDRINERNLDWYKTVARTRLQPQATVILLMTRWRDNDLAGKLLSEGGFEEIKLPAVCEDAENDPLGRVKGQALCPERYDEASLAGTRKDLGEMFFQALYQQNPIAEGGNIVLAEWIRYYDELPELEEVALFADLTYKDGEGNDFAVFEAWGRRGPDIYLIGQIRDRMGFPKQLDAFGRMCESYPEAFHKEIEEKANGAALIQVAKETIPGLIANNPKTSKDARLMAVAPLYRSGNVYYPNPDKHPWVRNNVLEITRFPRAEHDDTVDVASMAVARLGRVSSALRRLEALSKL